jgi:CDP-glucose 4,6-dehydratase
MQPSNIKNKNFYRGKRVFVTGHTGFKGAWLTAMLNHVGAEMVGYSLKPDSGSLFDKIGGCMLKHVEGDVRDFEHIKSTLCEFQPEIVLHLAAQAIVKDCFDNPLYAYETNVMGTVNLLEAIRECSSVKSVVVVTTDKVYENKGDGTVYVETDTLGGIDPYSSSKTCMEFITDTYKMSYLQTKERMVGISTVRASNVIGGGDHVSSRLIPSILNSIAAGKPVELRNPNQTRPWQSVLDALNGYLSIARLSFDEPEKYSSGWNIGPTVDGIKEVLWVVEKMRSHYKNAGDYIIGDTLDVHESKTLGLDISKALSCLDWSPMLNCDKMLYNVVDFFRRQQDNESEHNICMRQVEEFFSLQALNASNA